MFSFIFQCKIQSSSLCFKKKIEFFVSSSLKLLTLSLNFGKKILKIKILVKFLVVILSRILDESFVKIWYEMPWGNICENFVVMFE